MELSNKKIKWIIVIVFLIVIISLALFIFLLLKPESELTQQKTTKEENKKYDLVNGDAVVETGFLVGVGQNSIQFISLENTQKEVSAEEKEKMIESFNLSLVDPVTIVTQGTLDNRKKLDSFDLRIGQNVSIEYNKNTKNLITININKSNIDQNTGQINNKQYE